MTDVQRRSERTDILMFTHKRIEALMAESRALGFCQHARDLRIQARALYELTLDIGNGVHLDWIDEGFDNR